MILLQYIRNKFQLWRIRLRAAVDLTSAIYRTQSLAMTIRDLEWELRRYKDAYAGLQAKYDAVSVEEFRVSQILNGIRKHYQGRRPPVAVKNMLDL